ncbi:MAG TPA: hypothetical protein VKR53_17170 [Puia sp.]|nr:hypothetical protein [Puia sp.]
MSCKIFTFGLVFLFPAILCAQKLDSMISVYASNYQQEKVYVQIDKNLYNPGETIWFKAYVFSGNLPSTTSKNFYAELSDDNGNLLQRKIAPLYESTAAGNFDIPANIKSNHLHFRAYTVWMMNFDTAFLYDKDIRIINKNSDSSKNTETVQKRYLQFFPEGGDMIAGLENNIAFKAVDQYGKPIAIKGILQDASGKTIADFNSVHDGMGKLLLSPDKTDAFTAVWNDDLGTEHKTELPAVKSSGVVMRVLPANKKVFFSISRSSADSQQYSHLSIIACMHQFVVYKAKINLEENFMSGGAIPTDQLPSGVLQITVFNSDEMPVAERVVFVNNHDYELIPGIINTAKSLVRRGRNEIAIAIPDTLQANFSIAITDAMADGEKPNEDNIISRLLLTGDIKGEVNDPYYYFANSSDSLMGRLDLVMLTHGWRRFKWSDLAKGKEPVLKYHDQDYISANAEVFGINASQIAHNEAMNLIIKRKDSSTQMLQVPRLTGTKFGVSGLVFYDTATAYYQFNVSHTLSTQAAIVFSNGLYGGVRKIKPNPYPFNAWTLDDSASLKRNRFIEDAVANNDADQKIKTLATVTIKAREKSPSQKLDETYSSGLFSGGDAYIFNVMDDKAGVGFPDILTYLQGKVPGLIISMNGNGQATLSWRGGKPSVFLNEMQIDISQIQNTPVADIAMVKVFRPGGANSILGGGGSGAIAVYTKKGGEGSAGNVDFKGLEKARLIGYSAVKEFYSPDYANNPDANPGADVRTTLYWNPYILADKSNKRATIQFYNNDISKRVRIVIEGVNQEGKLAHVEKILE